MWNQAIKHSQVCIKKAHEYDKVKWDKSHKIPDFQVGDKLLVSTTNFKNLEGQKKLYDSFVGPFVIKALHGPNAVEVILSKEFENKHPVFPVSLIKHYKESDSKKFPHRNIVKVVVPPLNKEEKIPWKIINHRIIRKDHNDLRQYLVRYTNRSADEDEWLSENLIPEKTKLLRNYRVNKLNKIK